MAVQEQRDPALDGDDPASITGVTGALDVLGPAIDRALAAGRQGPSAAYVGDDVGLPADGAGLEVVIEELAGFVADGSGISMPGFFGFITTGGSTSAIAAQAAAAGMGGQRYLLHAFNHVEHLALRWLAELCGIPPSAAGVFTSGGSTANLVALGAARQWTFEQRGVDVAETGLPASPYRIYASARSHRTIHRAAAVLGMGRSSVCEIPTDTGGHLEVDALEAALVEDGRKGIVPAAIVAVAGTTDTGTVDDLARVGEIARRRGCWLHVDGAYGLVARACEDVRPLFEGVEEADSWIIDPHKWLATGVGTGAVYVRDGALLTRAFAEGPADYLEGSFASDEGPPVSQFDGIGGWWADQAVELSAPPRGVTVWAVLREIGRRGVEQRVRQHIGFARYLAERVRAHPRLELLCEPELSIVCFRHRPPSHVDVDAHNAAILEQLRRTTATVPSSTVVDGQFAIRPCFIDPRTARSDVDDLLQAVIRIGDDLSE